MAGTTAAGPAEHCSVKHEGERGAAVIEMLMVFAFLILPVSFLILTIPTWIQGVHAANDAAAEAGRAYVLSGGTADSVDRALAATAVSHGFDPGELTLAGRPEEAVRSGEVRVDVSVELQAITLFDLGAFTYTASHVERFPTYVRNPGSGVGP